MGHNIKLGQIYSNPFVKAFKPQTESPQSVSVQLKEESEDHEVGMANGQLDYIIKSANELKGKLGGEEKEIPGWIQDHISKAHSYLHQANSGYHEYDDTEDMNEEKLSFKKLKKGDILVGKFPPYKEMEVVSTTDKSAKVKSSKGAVIDIYSTNNYELKEQSMKLTKILNEENASFNKWLLKFVDDYISGGEFSKGSPQFQWALATLLSATLTDANFHQAAKKAKSVFRKAEEPDNSDQMEQLIKMKASDISKKAKWDGHDIIDGFAYVTAMRIGGPAMGNVTALKNESVTEVRENVSPRIARGKDTGDLIVQMDGKEYVVGFSADGYKNPYRIWPPKNDNGYDINKNATGKKLWAKMKPMVDKYLASKNEILDERLLNNPNQKLAGKTIKTFKSNGYGKGYTITLTNDVIIDIKSLSGTVYVSAGDNLLNNPNQKLAGKTIKTFKSNGFDAGYTMTLTNDAVITIKGGTIFVSLRENILSNNVNEGKKMTHKYNPDIEIELIEPTKRGWKVYQYEKGKKKIAHFDQQDINGKNAIFEVSVNPYSISEYGINENDYKFGEVEYTAKNMEPVDIMRLAFALHQTPIAKLAGKNMDNRIRVARDLGRMLGKNPTNPNEKGKDSAWLLYPYKNKLIDTGEYKQIYTDLMNKLKKISSSLQKGSVGDSSAAKAAAKADMKSENFKKTITESDKINFPNYLYEELKGMVWGDVCDKVLKFLVDRRGYRIMNIKDDDRIDLAAGGLQAFKEISQFLKNYGIRNSISKEGGGQNSWLTLRTNPNSIFDKNYPVK
jgi:hypothetical protein